MKCSKRGKKSFIGGIALPVFGVLFFQTAFAQNVNLAGASSTQGVSSSAQASLLDEQKQQTEKLLNHLSEVEDRLLEPNAANGVVPTQDCTALQIELAAEKLRANKFEQETALLRQEMEKLKQAKEQEILSVKLQESKTQGDLRACYQSIDEKNKLLNRLPEVQKKIDAIENRAKSSEEQLLSCQNELLKSAQLAQTIEQLEKDLIVARSELLLKEREIKLFSQTADPKRKGAVAPLTRAGQNLPGRQSQRTWGTTGNQAYAPQNTPPPVPPVTDVLIVEVIDEKVNLRSGPGEEHSPMMQVKKGTRLTVEKMEGEWYRVYTPTGSRAYIRKDFVRSITSQPSLVTTPSQRAPSKPPFRAGDDSNGMVPFGSVKLGGRSGASDPETRAFERLKMMGNPTTPVVIPTPVNPVGGEP